MMDKKQGIKEKSRMVHIRLPENLHKKVRIRAAEEDETIQDWVVESIKSRLEREAKNKSS